MLTKSKHMTDTLLHYLEWYIVDGCLKAETDKGTYKIEQSRDGFTCTYQPYIENIAVESGFITDAIQACENHYGPKFKNPYSEYLKDAEQKVKEN